MPKEYGPIDSRNVVTYPLASRKSKFSRTDMARCHSPGESLTQFLEGLPKVLAADQLKALARDIVTAFQGGRPVLVGMGSHVIKTGLSSTLIDLMDRGVVSVVAMNGSGIVHDIEMAMVGSTSEDVDEALPGGGFGMAEETALELNKAMEQASSMGLGRAVGQHILNQDFPHAHDSILAAAARLNLSATVHVALGTDVIHMHPDADGAAIGAGSLRDFRTFASAVSELGGGGVYLNLGSAVILPEIFLKALSLARNLGSNLDDIVTANLDFIQHYRTMTNVVRRPTQKGGKGYNLIGHHEILIPLLAAAIVEQL